MLYINSRVKVTDNSGAKIVKITNLKRKKNYKNSFVQYNKFVKGIVKKSTPNKKIKKKQFVLAFTLNLKKKYHRKNGIYINFFSNNVILVHYKIKRYQAIGTNVWIPALFELKHKKKYLQLSRAVRGFL